MRADVPPTTRASSQRLAVLLTLLAVLLFEAVAGDGERSPLALAAVVIAEITVVLALGWMARQWESVTAGDQRSRLVLVLCLATIPFIGEVLIRLAAAAMLPLELLLLSHFRNVVLALTVFAHRPECQRTACGLATFLAIFASALATQLWLQGLVAAFALIGIWWLMGTYWETLRGRLAATSQSDRSPRWWWALSAGVFSILIGLPVTGLQTRALSGFLPSSGGQDWYDQSARSGVGDGDHLVAGTENIQSFAPIEDALFLTSHEPSLYDLFDDTYNEPVMPRKADRAIALPPQQRTQPQDRELAASRQAGKQFSTLRKFGQPKPPKIGDRNSSALLYVKGRVPLHLKLEVFDRYDGIDWFPEELPEHSPQLTMETLHGRPWLRLPVTQSQDLYGFPETHALKIVRLDTNRIPAPTQLLGIHVDQLDRADFYLWAQPDVVRMDRDQLPSLLTIHIQSRTVDERRLFRTAAFLSTGALAYRHFGEDEESARVRRLAEEWTADIPRGWPQIQEVVARLRQEYQHDPQARPPEECRHTVAHFLLESRRGPDYQFASAAVQLLRSIGYSARLVSGFYVRPARYEARSRHTPVLAEDVHFWLEVYAGARDWIPLEPTPGYELLSPPPTWLERLQAAVAAVWQFLAEQWLPATTLLLVVVVAIVQRHRIADLGETTLWRWFPARDERRRIRQTVRLLLARCRRAGQPRPPGIMPTRWLQQRSQLRFAPERQLLVEFVRLADWASFAPHDSAAPHPHSRELCKCLVRHWTLSRLREAGRVTACRSSGARVCPRFLFGETVE